MNKQEFLLLIPGIIYGVAIIDLLKVFTHKDKYIEIVGWGTFSLLVFTYNWTILYNQLDLIVNVNLNFYLVILQAILISALASIITPEEKDVDTKKYFLEVRKNFFLLFAVFLVSGILMKHFVFHESSPIWLRPFAVLLVIICAYSNWYWLRITILVILTLLAALRIFSDIIY